ncbi:MAG: hypothetical protein RMJ87_13620, partial [Cytophagales bacterium]|nr:hypothetical protein [Bernardetiaceae bacterium]MDW8206061.1 hypothetical protein [Cytophagales bacterium]
KASEALTLRLEQEALLRQKIAEAEAEAQRKVAEAEAEASQKIAEAQRKLAEAEERAEKQAVEIAKKMIAAGAADDFIAQVTGLAAAQVAQLRQAR